MRILSIGNFGTGWDGSICDEEHIAKALESLGHVVHRLQREELQDSRPVSDIFPSHGYDFILLAQWDGYPESMLPWLKKDDCPIVYWAFDHQTDGQEWHERLVAGADLYLSKPFSDSKYPNWRWLSQDFAPEFLYPKDTPTARRDIDVLFTGSWVPWESGQARVEVLKAIDKRYNLQINSVTPDQWKAEGFKNVQGPVMDKDLIDLIARTKVNISMDHVHAPGYWSDRNAQIMACGGVVLFRHVPMSEAIFKDHVFYFYDTEDCLDKIGRILKLNYNDYDQMGERNYQYARRYLTATARVKELEILVKEIL